jgi:hypothetical protein
MRRREFIAATAALLVSPRRSRTQGARRRLGVLAINEMLPTMQNATMYRDRFPTGAPPLEMRVMTEERRGGIELADDLPNYDGHSGKFMLKLITAWIAMSLRRPEITLGKTVRRSQ